MVLLQLHLLGVEFTWMVMERSYKSIFRYDRLNRSDNLILAVPLVYEERLSQIRYACQGADHARTNKCSKDNGNRESVSLLCIAWFRNRLRLYRVSPNVKRHYACKVYNDCSEWDRIPSSGEELKNSGQNTRAIRRKD